MILSSIGTLSELHQHILTARFTPQNVVCQCARTCCKGFHPTLRWLCSTAWLSDFVGNVYPKLVSHRRLRDGIVARHFGDKVLLGDIAKRCGVHINTMSKHNSEVVAILRNHEKQARFEVRAILESSGLVGN